MKYIVRIDRSSIKKNPDAGRTMFPMPGCWMPDGKGGMTRGVNMVYQMQPDPNYLAKNAYCEVTCAFCSSKFSHKDLEEDREYIYPDEDYYYIDNICPKCGQRDCCEIEYEKFDQKTGKVIEVK